MTTIKGTITQGGANTYTSSSIDTNITVDGRTGWEIKAFRGFYSNFNLQVAADIAQNLILATIATVTTLDQKDEITRVAWQAGGTLFTDAFGVMEPMKAAVFSGSRLTVQPFLYVNSSSTGQSAAGIMYWELDYELVKLTDIEVLRLLQGGA
jgi:hypothetical protein